MSDETIEMIAHGRTDKVFDHVGAGRPATSTDERGVPLIKWCAYFGDVSAMRCLLAHGESLETLDHNRGLNGAAFHGHWRLCQFLIESGADVNAPLPDTDETPLHASLCKADSVAHTWVVRVLLGAGAEVNCVTAASVETGAFMRDVRTRGETPLHRAAAYGTEQSIDLLLNAGANIDAKDIHGDSPLTWASRHLRPTHILRKLCYADFRIRPDHTGMQINLLGAPHI